MNLEMVKQLFTPANQLRLRICHQILSVMHGHPLDVKTRVSCFQLLQQSAVFAGDVCIAAQLLVGFGRLHLDEVPAFFFPLIGASAHVQPLALAFHRFSWLSNVGRCRSEKAAIVRVLQVFAKISFCEMFFCGPTNCTPSVE